MTVSCLEYPFPAELLVPTSQSGPLALPLAGTAPFLFSRGSCPCSSCLICFLVYRLFFPKSASPVEAGVMPGSSLVLSTWG